MVYFLNGLPLFESGKAASAQECCCGNVVCGPGIASHPCCSDIETNGEWVVWAGTQDFDITLPGGFTGAACCTAQNNRTVVAPFDSSDTWRYFESDPCGGETQLTAEFYHFCTDNVCTFEAVLRVATRPPSPLLSSRWVWRRTFTVQQLCRSLDLILPFAKYNEAFGGPMCGPAGDPGDVRVAVH